MDHQTLFCGPHWIEHSGGAAPTWSEPGEQPCHAFGENPIHAGMATGSSTSTTCGTVKTGCSESSIHSSIPFKMSVSGPVDGHAQLAPDHNGYVVQDGQLHPVHYRATYIEYTQYDPQPENVLNPLAYSLHDIN